MRRLVFTTGLLIVCGVLLFAQAPAGIQAPGARGQAEGFFAGELAPVGAVAKDECNRPETTIDALARLAPVFDTTSGQGSVTAGNSSQLSDGASATLVMSMERANALKLKPLLVFRGSRNLVYYEGLKA